MKPVVPLWLFRFRSNTGRSRGAFTDALRWVLANPGGISLSGRLSALVARHAGRPFFADCAEIARKSQRLGRCCPSGTGSPQEFNGAAEIPAQAGGPTSELKLGKNAVEIAQAHRCGFEIVTGEIVTGGFHQAVGAEVQPAALNIVE